MPALANAHDHCRPLSPTSFGGADKPLELWLLRLAAMPAIDPYLGALAAFGRAARGGAGSVMAHYTRFHTPRPGRGGAGARAGGGGCRRARDARGVHARPQPPRLWRLAKPCSPSCRRRRARRSQTYFGAPAPSAAEQIARVEAIADAVEEPELHRAVRPQRRAMVLRRIAGRRSPRPAPAPGGACTCISWRRAISAPSPTADYPEGVAARLERLGLLSPRLTLAHCVYAREDELDAIVRHGVTIATNPSSNLHLRSGIAPIGEAIRRGARVALGVDASAFDEDDDILRELRLGHFLHGGWGFESAISREDWLAAIVANGRRANGAPGSGALEVGEPADVLVLDLDRLDRDAVMPVAPIDLLFARAHAAHVDALYVAGRAVSPTAGSPASISKRSRRSCARNTASACPRAPTSSKPGRRSRKRSLAATDAAERRRGELDCRRPKEWKTCAGRPRGVWPALDPPKTCRF